MIKFENIEFKRLCSFLPYKWLRIAMGQMSFSKDFIHDDRGDLYPLVHRSPDCIERVELKNYMVDEGQVERWFCRFFPYATYEATFIGGRCGFSFRLPSACATVTMTGKEVVYLCGDHKETFPLPEPRDGGTLLVSCRPSAFDIYQRFHGVHVLLGTVKEPLFRDSNQYEDFMQGSVTFLAEAPTNVFGVQAYLDNGISMADMRPIRYENGEIMVENGRVYLSATVRMVEGAYQGIFAWVPGTAELSMTGALFYDAGDGKWCGDVAASILYHRAWKRWLLWVCSFSHGHILGHSEFEGDPRFGINVIDIQLMPHATEENKVTDFVGFPRDEDPDFFYDEENRRWLMAICRTDPTDGKYRYCFFASDSPFHGYRFIGRGFEGEETGGSFVKVHGEQYFVCGNSFRERSDYRIYSKGGMETPKFDLPDGGFRGWGTLMPVKQGSRVRYYWMTFDRQGGSDYRWSYGNLYFFEAYGL